MHAPIDNVGVHAPDIFLSFSLEDVHECHLLVDRPFIFTVHHFLRLEYIFQQCCFLRSIINTHGRADQEHDQLIQSLTIRDTLHHL